MAHTTPTGRAIFGDHADRARPAQVAQQPQGLAVVLAHLVLDIADTGIGHSQLGQLAVAGRLDDRPACGNDYGVDLLLRPGFINALRSAGARHQFGDRAGNLRGGCRMFHRRFLWG
jgi:hypothetical protein